MDEELIQDFKELFEFDTEKKKNILNKLISENIIKGEKIDKFVPVKPKKKYFIWHIQGGLGKNIAATALCKSIKETYPDRELIMVVSYPEAFLNNPHIDRVYNIGQAP